MTDDARAAPPAPSPGGGPSFTGALRMLGIGAAVIAVVLGAIAAVSPDLAAGAVPGVVVTAVTVLRTRRAWWGLAAGTAAAALGAVAVLVSTDAAPAAVFMALVGVGVGVASRAGLRGTAITAAMFTASTVVAPDPPLAADGPWAEAAAVGAAILVGAVAMHSLSLPLTRRLLPATLTPAAPADAAVVGAALAVPLGVATAAIVSGPHEATSGWLLATMIVLVQPDTARTLLRSAERAAGTALGAGVAAVIAAAAPQPWESVAIALVAATYAWAYRLSHPAVEHGRGYWIFAAPWTVAIVLLAAPSGLTLPTAEERAALTAVGAVAIAASVPIIRVVGARVVRSHRRRHGGEGSAA